MRITAQGHLLASDRAARTITYRLLPYGQEGRTSMGRVTASQGSVTLPDDPASLVLNMEHDPTRPVGRGRHVIEDAEGLVATFAVAGTSAGDDLLAEVEQDLRPGVSVELDGVVIRGGRLIRSQLVGAGAVVSPAFPTATALLVAADTPETETEDEDPEDEDSPGEDPQGEDPETETGPGTDEGDPMEDTLTATVPAGLPATTTPRAAADRAAVVTLLAARDRGDRSPELTAALSDITATANVAVDPPQWLGEVWSGSPFQRRIIPLIGQAKLTSRNIVGWKWSVAPVGGDYAGDKAAVPSNAAVTVAVNQATRRFAGAHDQDRELRDFDPAGYWESYWSAMAASYAKWSDDHCAADMIAAAPAVVASGTGVVQAIVDGVMAILPKGSPSFVLLGASAYAEMAKVDPLAFLSGSLNLSDASGAVGGLSFRASDAVAVDQVLVGNRNAATHFELGSTPLRAEALNIANGGIDTGAFGYAGTLVHDAAGLAKVTVTQPAPVGGAARK